ncbi:MAG TPA: YncE family protein [Thermoanaerobaculia bacterium]|nr:YncE family protein [Thermoanaerobaculia bacterium]
MKKMTLVLALGLAAELQAAYHVVRHIPIGGTGGWDYLTVDSAARRLYVSHSDRVEVVDIDRQKIVGTIPKTEGVHGIAIAPDLHRGFVSNGRANSMTIFDLDKLSTINEVKTSGDNPDAILYDPATKHVFTFNGRGQNTTVFDGDGKTVATIPLGGKPEFAQSDRAGHVFVNIEDKNEIVDIDAKNLTVAHRWAIAPCEEPSGLAIDRAHHRLFAVCGNQKMVVVDNQSGAVVASVQIGKGVDGAAFDDKKQMAFSSNGADATITVVREVSPKDFEIAENVPTLRGARTIALDEKTGHVFVPTAQFGPPPAPTPDRPRPRPSILPDTFEVIEVAP